jgi:transposase
MKENTTYVGLDVSKKKIQVATLFPPGELLEWQIAHTEQAVKRMAKKLHKRSPGQVVACYEAGPFGYALQRQVQKLGIVCKVVAPSLIPKKPGEKIKTDRRDAKKLATLLRGELLTEVRPPSEEEETVRDLCRARESLQKDLMRCRHRVVKMLLRRGMTYTKTKTHWGYTHKRWLQSVKLEEETSQVVYDDALFAVEQLEQRIDSLVKRIEVISEEEPYREVVGLLRCFRGINTITAMGLITELHEFRRFEHPRSLMCFLGLVPREYSSGEARFQGGITKTGNNHARRLLVEMAWHYQHRPRVSGRLQQRQKDQPTWAVSIANKAQHRLYRRMWRLKSRGKEPQKVAVAVARELCGFIWAVLHAHATQSLAAA